MDWSDWIQSVAGGVIGQAATAQYVLPYEIEKLKLTQLGQMGYYAEGQPMLNRAGASGISPTVLVLAGAAVVAVLLLKD